MDALYSTILAGFSSATAARTVFVTVSTLNLALGVTVDRKK